MSYPNKRKALFMVVSMLVILSLACMSSGSSEESGQTEGGTSDLEATAAALEATQRAMEAQAQAPPQNEEPAEKVAPPAAEDGGEIESPIVPETNDLPSDGIDWDSYSSDQMIYSADFDSDPTNWYTDLIVGEGNWETWVGNGVLTYEINSKRTQVASIYEGLWVPRDQGIAVEASFDNVGSVRNNNIILMCNINEDGWYEFIMTSSGLWGIYRFDFDKFTWTELTSGGLPNYNKNVTDHVITALCDSNGDLAFGYDYTLLKNSYINDRTYREGYTGISIATMNLPGVEIEFDWFQLIKP